MRPSIVSLDAPTRIAGRPRAVRPMSPVRLPVMMCRIAAGFPSPASDYIEDVIDLNRHLIRQGHEAATFILRVEGWSMIGAGIFDGDEVVVDRAIEPRVGHIVIACRGGELTIKRLAKEAGRLVLKAENPHFRDITPAEGEEWTVWGVATRVLHKL